MVTTRRAVGSRGPFIHKLTDEILLQVLEDLNSFSKNAILAAALVCPRWHALAQRVIDGNIGPLVLSPHTEEQNAKLFKRMNHEASFRQRVHHLSVDEWYKKDMTYHAFREDPWRRDGYFSRCWSESVRNDATWWNQMRPLKNAIAKLRLSTFTWNATPCMPRLLIQALAQSPPRNVQIGRSDMTEVHMEYAYAPFANYRYIKNLRLLPKNLTSLDIMPPAVDTDLLHDIGHLVWSAVNLRELRINAMGCMWFPNKDNWAGDHPYRGNFTTIRSLDWIARPDDTECTDVLRLSFLELSNVCICGDVSHKTFIEQMDWSRLRDITITCSTMLEIVSHKASRLTALAITLPSGRDCEYATCVSVADMHHVAALLSTFTSLRHLNLVNGTQFLTPSLLQDIGHDLNILHVHERTQGMWQPDSRPLLSSNVLEHIASSCPKLSYLALDVPYHDEPYFTFISNVVQTIPTIKSLAIYRELEGPETWEDDENSPRSTVAISTVQNDFVQLQSMERRSSLVLFEVNITSMPPIYLDKDRFEGSNAWTHKQKHLVVENVENNAEKNQIVLRMRDIRLEKKWKRERAVPYPINGNLNAVQLLESLGFR